MNTPPDDDKLKLAPAIAPTPGDEQGSSADGLSLIPGALKRALGLESAAANTLREAQERSQAAAKVVGEWNILVADLRAAYCELMEKTFGRDAEAKCSALIIALSLQSRLLRETLAGMSVSRWKMYQARKLEAKVRRLSLGLRVAAS